MGHAKKERVLLFGTDQRITSGPAATRPHSKAEYMTAPERFADSQIPLAPRAPSIHGPSLRSLRCTSFGRYRSNSGREGRARQKREKSASALMITAVGYDVPWRDVSGPVGTVVAAEEMGSLDFLRIVLRLSIGGGTTLN
jgi:hypothetical protein